MNYLEWFETHSQKHAKILKKLTTLSEDEVVEYFRFENMVKNELDFCLLYATNTRCHDIKELNCYLCACPHFRFNDKGFKKIEDKKLLSFCSVNSKNGSQFITKDVIHQDCSNCLIPHKKNYIQKVFKRDWVEIMKEVK